MREADKFDAMTRIIDIEPDFYGIVFCRTKIGVDEVATRLVAQGYSAEGLHGDVSQAQREKILRKFRDKAVNILVATDVAARGIDVSNLSHVINYSLPQDSESYVHRIGRTGRAGNQGTAITFISGAELRRFNWMMRDIKADIKRETLPSPQDIVAMKRAKIKDDLQEIVANESYGDYADIAAELLESYAPDVALGALLRLAFRSELDQSNYPEIRSFSVDRKGKARLFLALGGRDGYTARRIVEMLKRKCGLRDKNIDDVRVFENYSLVSVPFSDAEAVVGHISGLLHGCARNRAIVVAEFTTDGRRYANIGYFVSQKELELPEADIRWSVGPAADGYEITLSSDRFVRAVWLALDGNEHFEDNYFDLVPGVSKTVRVATTLSRSEFDRLLRITHLQQTR